MTVVAEDQVGMNVGANGSPDRSASGASEGLVDLGIWLSGIVSFAGSSRGMFHTPAGGGGTKEVEILQSGLKICFSSVLQLRSERLENDEDVSMLSSIADILRGLVISGDALLRSGHIDRVESEAWGALVAERLASDAGVAELRRMAVDAGGAYLPPLLLKLARGEGVETDEMAELSIVLPAFARVVRWLNIVAAALRDDLPLKSTLLIFADVCGQVASLSRYINSRLEHFPERENELFASLDAAAYTTSLELRKVFGQELANLGEIRSATAIYARVETAYALLNDGFQQILAGFALVVDPSANIEELFPAFRIKQERSLVLRDELRKIAEQTTAAENDPDDARIEVLHDSLRRFVAEPVKYLFYKDIETLERFVDEILVTRDTKDLVPILHRFAAYIDTLFGQVSLRFVLRDHPI